MTRPGPSAADRDRGVVAAIRRANRTKRPEHSLAVRVSVLAAVEIGVLAVIVAGAADTVVGIATMLGLPLGAVVSHRRRHHDNLGIKLALSVGVLVSMAAFLSDVRVASSIDDTRAPLATLFLVVQVLHGFDLPQRRDLGFSLASSLTLVALAGASTHRGAFGLLLLAYAATAAVAMVALTASASRERADDLAAELADGGANVSRGTGGDPEELDRTGEERARRGGGPAPSGQVLDGAALRGALVGVGGEVASFRRAALPAVLAGLLLFGLLPRPSSAQLGGLPFDGFPGSPLGGALVSNDAFSPGRDGSQPAAGFTPSSYVGFSEYADLRTVGTPDRTPVLRVRSERPRFWRGVVFDVYDGAGWRRTAEQPDPTHGRPVRLSAGTVPTSSTDLVQTYELLSDTPNLVFGAGDVEEVWHAGGSVVAWDDDTITTPAEQDEGTIYSVRSRVLATAPGLLREVDEPQPEALQQRYTQLPAELPQRVRSLAEDVAGDASTPYAAAEAVEDWLGEHVTYTRDAAPPPDAGDLVDHFLFEARRGWCEPIAASMVVLLRSLDVPARYVTGFAPGSRNPITGVWDVTLADAHAWVEVHVPGEGWVPFDPTGSVPQAVDGSSASSVPLFDVVRSAADAVQRGLAAVVGAVPPPARPVIAALAGTLLLTGLVLGAAAWQRRRTARLAAAQAAEDALRPWQRLAAMLVEHELALDGSRTPRESVRHLGWREPLLPDEALELLCHDEERRRYASPATRSSGDGPVAAEVEQALAAVRHALVERKQRAHA